MGWKEVEGDKLVLRGVECGGKRIESVEDEGGFLKGL